MTTREPEERERDLLSTFLMVAVGVLALMYALDWYHERALTQHAAAANALRTGELERPGCAVHPVGGEGTQILVECEALSAEQLKALLANQPEGWPAGVTEVALRGPTQTLLCSPDLADCQAHARPERSFYEEARRRRPRER